MDMEMVGWIAIAWFALALAVSIALGGFLGQVNASSDEDVLVSAMAKRKGMRFMRASTRASTRSVAIRDLRNEPRISETTGKRSARGTG